MFCCTHVSMFYLRFIHFKLQNNIVDYILGIISHCYLSWLYYVQNNIFIGCETFFCHVICHLQLLFATSFYLQMTFVSKQIPNNKSPMTISHKQWMNFSNVICIHQLYTCIKMCYFDYTYEYNVIIVCTNFDFICGCQIIVHWMTCGNIYIIHYFGGKKNIRGTLSVNFGIYTHQTTIFKGGIR